MSVQLRTGPGRLELEENLRVPVAIVPGGRTAGSSSIDPIRSQSPCRYNGPSGVFARTALLDSFVEPGEHHVGPVVLVAVAAEVLPRGAEVGGPGDAVLHQLAGLRPVAGAGVDVQSGLEGGRPPDGQQAPPFVRR